MAAPRHPRRAAPTASGDTIPEETAGPFPGDGSNGPNILTESGVVREDITKSVGDASGVAEGIPTTVNLKLLDVAGGGGPLAGAAVYLWHCDREGRYSLYDESIAGENYLRGVQESGADGTLTFKTIFPAAYQGRWPHVHFEVYESLDAAVAGQGKLRTSQLAIPQETCEAVYATAGYEQSVQNLAGRRRWTPTWSSATATASQLAAVSGSVEDGLHAHAQRRRLTAPPRPRRTPRPPGCRPAPRAGPRRAPGPGNPHRT